MDTFISRVEREVGSLPGMALGYVQLRYIAAAMREWDHVEAALECEARAEIVKMMVALEEDEEYADYVAATCSDAALALDPCEDPLGEVQTSHDESEPVPLRPGDVES